MKQQILDWERQLYSKGRVADKYAILERMRLVFDRLYQEDRPLYDERKKALKENTRDALEELWTLWNPTPKTHVDWVGPNQFTCVLKPSHPRYAECAEIGFIKCQYDEHGSPDFSKITCHGSIVDVSDLYDSLSADTIHKRGGSSNSLQEIAQRRMAENLKPTIEKWAKENNRQPDFWKWRDSHDLVPHEDTNCRTMRLVSRAAHDVFKHRGGVANANTIKNHFPS